MALTSKMQGFLVMAAEAAHGKGILIGRDDRPIASKAVSAGYGWMITAPMRVFIIDEKGRAALRETASDQAA